MRRITILFFPIIALLNSCSMFKPVFKSSSVITTLEQKNIPEKESSRFLENISASIQHPIIVSEIKLIDFEAASITPIEKNNFQTSSLSTETESFNSLQIKYAILLNTEAEQINNNKMFSFVDSWFGTRYCYGGESKSCIDCSAFVQFLFDTVYAVKLPRTTKEQFKYSKKISRTELHEGDLIFFNTRRGVSHVGVYLQNNKFVHAAVSGGVMISDLFDPYWLRRFIGVGRIEKSE